jgi:2-methylisocitrate lyase-like PEP mutase family enzyme
MESSMTRPVPNPTPANRLRALINAADILVLPGVFDGFSTRLVEKMGYTAAFITPEQLETKYGSQRKAAIRPGNPAAKPTQTT